MKLYKLPQELRDELGRGMGLVIRGGDYLRVAYEVVRNVGDCGRLWAVGDVICLSLIRVGCVPKVCVVDGKTLRTVMLNVNLSSFTELFRYVFRVVNPPGTLSEESVAAVRSAVDVGSALIVVNGEEDLLGLLVLMYADLGDYLVYGLPGVGVDLVKVTEEVRCRALELFTKFTQADG